MESNPPLVFYWIATYKNNTAYPEFDHEDGHENFFKHIDQSKLLKFGFYTFSENLSKLLRDKGVPAVSKALPDYEIVLEEGQRLICVKTGAIRNFTYRICHKCNHRWQFSKKNEGTFFKVIINQNDKQVPYASAICPDCKTMNRWVCPKCNIALTMVGQKTSGKLYCTQCKEKFEHHIKRYADRERYTVYKLGWQATINDKNVKSILHIDSNGNAKIGV